MEQSKIEGRITDFIMKWNQTKGSNYGRLNFQYGLIIEEQAEEEVYITLLPVHNKSFTFCVSKLQKVLFESFAVGFTNE